MSRPVPLIRRFTPISQHYQDSDLGLEDLWSVLGTGDRTEWTALREAYRCVILASAGAGKTFEMKAEAGRLAARGLPAFFIRIEDIDDNFGDAFEVGTREAFEAWLAGTGEAWFYLDSVDEVRLEAPRAFETAIRAFADRIHDARQRAHVYISSRPYAWRSRLDRALIEELLPYVPPVGEPVSEEGDGTQATQPGNEPAPGLLLYRLAPLDGDDIRIFAGHRGITNADALIDALSRTDLGELAQLPFDLEDILAVWQETGSLDSRLAVLERGLDRRLSPPPGVFGALRLPQALEGARRLAIAATLTAEASIRMPGGAGTGLDAAAVLHDWSEPAIRQLLERGIFTDAIYGMVRFRHRETRELLAARWLAGVLENSERRDAVEGELFREVYGEAVVVPRTRPLLPWLILFDERIRDRALALQPEIMTEGGDPARLPPEVRQAILRDLVARIADGDRRGGDNSAIARIAHGDLTAETLDLLARYGRNDDVIFFLGRLVWQGAMTQAAGPLAPIALDPARGIYARIVSARAVATVGGASACHELWAALNGSGEVLPRRLLAELVDGAPADPRSLGLLLASLDTLEPHQQFEPSGLGQALHRFIERLPLNSDRVGVQPLASLVEGLAGFLAREPFVERRECKVSQANSWLMGPALHAVERLAAGRSQSCLEEAALDVLGQVPALRQWGDSDDREYRSRMGELVPRWTGLNDALFWHTVAMARAARDGTDERVDDDWTVSWLGHFWAFDAASFERTAAWIADRTLPDDRLVALTRAFRTYAQNGRPRAWRRRLWRAVGGDPLLEARLRTLMRPPASAQARRWKANERRWDQRRRKREAKEAAAQAMLAARLARNPDALRAPSGLKPGEMTWDQAFLLQEIEGDGLRMSRGAGSRWESLIPRYGREVAEAFRDGALRQWRLYRPVLRSEDGGSSSIPFALIYAMAGLEIEAGEDGLGLTRLPGSEARHALRFAFSELNGFPAWFEPLYRAHPQAGFDLVWGETRWELDNSGPEPMHYVLHDLVYHAPWLHRDMAPHLYDWLRSHGAANDDCLRFARTIMESGGIGAQQRAVLGQSRALAEATPEGQRPAWFAMWVDNAPGEAIAELDRRLAAMPRPDDARFAEQFAVSLMGGRRHAGSASAGWKTPEYLKALYVLLYRHVRRAEDIDRANGRVYSPTTRDNAQEARNNLFNLLSAMPGEATYHAIMALAEDHPEPDYRAWMRRHAYDRAVADSDREWSLGEVLGLGRHAP